MRTFYIITFLILFLVIFSCTEKNIMNDESNISEINIQVSFDEINSENLQFSKGVTITSVKVTVSGDNMSTIEKNLSISGSAATGSVSVPKGDNRTFLIEGFNQNTLLFDGERTVDLTNDQENVSINAVWHTQNVTVQVNIPSQFPGEFVNKVEVNITGDGLNSPQTETLNISGGTAQKVISIRNGAKQINARASLTFNQNSIVLFNGTKNEMITNSTTSVQIPLSENSTDEHILNWHDGSFEGADFGDQGDILAAGFDVSNMGPVFLKSVSFNVSWSGNQGDYRVVAFDGFVSTPRFRSVILSPESDGLVTKNLIWSNPVDGIFQDILIVGFEYASTTLWPDMGFDNSQPDSSCFFFDSAQSQWFQVTDGDYAINAIVQTRSGSTAMLKPSVVLTDDQLKHRKSKDKK